MKNRILFLIGVTLFTYIIYGGSMILGLTNMDRIGVIFFANVFGLYGYIISFKNT